MRINPLDEIPSSWVVGIFFFTLYVLIGSGFAYLHQLQQNQNVFTQGEFFTLQSVLFAFTYPIISLSLWFITQTQREELVRLLLNVPAPAEIPQYIWLGVGMLISAMGFTYLLYYPLSFIAPDLVQAWLLDTPPLLYWDEQGYYWLGNLAAMLTAVIFAPVLEEFIFRGYLLNRWTLKIGVLPAILLSAGLFAFLHNDMLGAFVFGVLQSLLYIKTRSLVGPIIVHFVNNVLAVSIEWVDHVWGSGFATMTMQDFYDQGIWGVVGVLIGIPWLWLYARKHFSPYQALLVAHQQGGETPNARAIG